METLNTQAFKEKVFDFDHSTDWKFKGHRPAIIDFYADWCGPCKALSPVLERVAHKYKGMLDVYKVDTEMSPEVAAKFGIRGIPSLLFIPPQGQPAMVSGFIPEEGFDQVIGDIFKIEQP